MSRNLINLPNIKYVNDNQGLTSSRCLLDKGEVVIPRAQKELNDWQQLAAVSGGALNHGKTTCWILDYKWEKGKWKYRTEASLPGKLTLIDQEGQRRPITRLKPSQAHKILGFFPAADGNWKEEIKYLKETGSGFAHWVKRRRIKNRTDVWIALKSMLWGSWTYPQRALTLTWNNWNNIMTEPLKTCLPRAGMARNFPRVVLFGPSDFQGNGLKHPYFSTEITKLGVLWEAMTKPSLEAEVILSNFELLRLEFGTPDPMTDVPYNRMHKATTTSWIKSVWQISQEFRLTSEDRLVKPHLQRVYDCFLMHIFINNPDLSPDDLRILNECRMFLQVVTLSDLCSACGKYLLLSTYEGEPTEHNLHHYIWPRHQKQLSQEHLDLWQKTL